MYSIVIFFAFVGVGHKRTGPNICVETPIYSPTQGPWRASRCSYMTCTLQCMVLTPALTWNLAVTSSLTVGLEASEI